MNKNTTLYNVIFPIWLLFMIPITWIYVLPANFIIDSLVIIVALYLLKVDNLLSMYKKTILKVWILGFISDLVGSAFMFGGVIFNNNTLIHAVTVNPFASLLGFLWVMLCIFIAAVCIYYLNYSISFKKVDLEDHKKKKLAISLALLTAPYLFLLPLELFI